MTDEEREAIQCVMDNLEFEIEVLRSLLKKQSKCQELKQYFVSLFNTEYYKVSKIYKSL